MSLTAEKVTELVAKWRRQAATGEKLYRSGQVDEATPIYVYNACAHELETLLNAALAEADGPTPWAYAIETPGGDMYDGEYAVFGDKHSAQDQVDCLNDDLDESEEQYKLVPLFRGEPSPAAEGRKK
jgi:hypothetical protein